MTIVEHKWGYGNKCVGCGIRQSTRSIFSGINDQGSCSKHIFSCCQGKSGGSSRWDNDAQAWKCTDCGSPTSTDPNYVSGKSEEFKPWWVRTPKQCECGGEKAKTTHAFYCPLWVKY